MERVIKIESLKTSDWGLFRQLFLKIIETDFGHYPKEVRQKYGREEPWKKVYQKGKAQFVVAKRGREIVGYLISGTEGGGVSYANWLGVSRRYRRLGIGGELIRDWEDRAKLQGVHKLRATTSIMKNQEFWEKRGFKLEGTKRNDRYHLTYWIFGKQL